MQCNGQVNEGDVLFLHHRPHVLHDAFLAYSARLQVMSWCFTGWEESLGFKIIPPPPHLLYLTLPPYVDFQEKLVA